MEIDDKIQLSIEDLKKIVHGLHMASFGFVEDDAMDEIKLMIKALPSPEQIDKMIQTPKAIKNLQVAIGRIMKLIELYGKRDIEYKVRYKSRTNLPPRYKVLDWKGASMKSREEIKSNASMDLVKLSSLMDETGFGEESSKLLKCARKIINNQVEESDIEEVVVALRNVGMVKEAQLWQQMKGFMGGAVGKVKNVLTDVWQAGQAGGLEAKFNAVYKQLVDFKTQIDSLATKANDPGVRQKMANLSQAIELSETQINKAATDIKTTATQETAQTVPQNAQQTPPPIPQPASQNPAVQNLQVEEVASQVKQPNTPDLNQAITTLQSLNKVPGINQTTLKGLINQIQKQMNAAPITASSFNLKLHKLSKRS